jgi:hypothetical protein
MPTGLPQLEEEEEGRRLAQGPQNPKKCASHADSPLEVKASGSSADETSGLERRWNDTWKIES